ncbi:DUF4179 domain-containing protein [Effusibacillus consociatus]|uniref:DUF4179 domain-containing protein n=1 Tax=Effusibacillus consociatus TaxID=1117041 RepID=A0ABV9Q3Y1_9BACL
MKNENKDFEAFLRKNFKGIEMKVHIPEIVPALDESPVAKRPFLRSNKGFITAATIVLLLLAGLTPQARAIYQSWFGGPLVDPGLQQAEKQGNIQTPNASVTDQGITVTLQAVSADSTRTVLQVNVQGTEADDVLLEAVTLSDEKGKTYRLQSQDHSLGRIQFEPFDSGVKEAVLQVTSIKGVKGDWLIRFPVKRFESRIVTPNIKIQMPEGYTLTINKIDFALTQTQIDITFTSPYTPIWATITENGKVANLTRGARDQKDPQLMHIFFDPVEGTQPMTLKLEFYNKPDVIVQIPKL